MNRQKRYVDWHREHGLCLFCAKKVVSGRTLCEYHLEQHRIAVQKMKKIYKEEGRCPQCGAYLNDDIDKHCVYCINCRERNMSIRGNKNEITRKDIT